MIQLISSSLKNPLSPIEDSSEQRVSCWTWILFYNMQNSGAVVWAVFLNYSGSWPLKMCHQCGSPSWPGLSTSDLRSYEDSQRSGHHTLSMLLLLFHCVFIVYPVLRKSCVTRAHEVPGCSIRWIQGRISTQPARKCSTGNGANTRRRHRRGACGEKSCRCFWS